MGGVAPPLFRLNGFGVALYGERDPRPDGSHIATHALCALFIPILALGAYRVINHGNGYITIYAHMSRLDVVAGQRVKRGDQLGMMGSTGRSTGTHLHFEIRTAGGALDPLAALR